MRYSTNYHFLLSQMIFCYTITPIIVRPIDSSKPCLPIQVFSQKNYSKFLHNPRWTWIGNFDRKNTITHYYPHLPPAWFSKPDQIWFIFCFYHYKFFSLLIYKFIIKNSQFRIFKFSFLKINLLLTPYCIDFKSVPCVSACANQNSHLSLSINQNSSSKLKLL